MFCEKLSQGGVDGHLVRERVGDVGIEPPGATPLRVEAPRGTVYA